MVTMEQLFLKKKYCMKLLSQTHSGFSDFILESYDKVKSTHSAPTSGHQHLPRSGCTLTDKKRMKTLKRFEESPTDFQWEPYRAHYSLSLSLCKPLENTRSKQKSNTTAV